MNDQFAHDMPKDAATPVVESHRAMRENLPFSDRRDFADAARGFMGTRAGVRILSDKGRVVWSSSSRTISSAKRRRRRP